jgi:hypothetical protein
MPSRERKLTSSTAGALGGVRKMSPVDWSMTIWAYVPAKVCTGLNTCCAGRAAGGRVPIVVAPVPLVLVCETAPCRWMTPELSLYQAGARELNPALPVQLAVLIDIGCGVVASRVAAGVAA